MDCIDLTSDTEDQPPSTLSSSDDEILILSPKPKTKRKSRSTGVESRSTVVVQSIVKESKTVVSQSKSSASDDDYFDMIGGGFDDMLSSTQPQEPTITATSSYDYISSLDTYNATYSQQTTSSQTTTVSRATSVTSASKRISPAKRKEEKKRKAAAAKGAKLQEKRRKMEVKEGHRVKIGHEVYRKKELVVCMERKFASFPVGKKFMQALQEEGFAGNVHSDNSASKLSAITFERKHWLRSSDSANEPWAVQVDPETKLAILDTSKKSTVESLVLLFWPAEDFVDKLFNCSDTTYAPLMDALKGPIRHHKSISSNGKHVVLILQGVNEHIAMLQRVMAGRTGKDAVAKKRRMSREGLENALTWLYVAYGIETLKAPDEAHSVKLMVDLTKAISKKPYEMDPCPYDILAVYKSFSMRTSELKEADAVSKNDVSNERMHEMWVNMLRCFPRVSEKMARKIAEVFPTFRSLYEKYLSPTLSLEEKETLIADSYTGKTRPKQLSKFMYHHFTTNNSNRLY